MVYCLFFYILRDPIPTGKKDGNALVDLLGLDVGAAGGAPIVEGAMGGDPWAPVRHGAGGPGADPWSGSSSTVTSPQDPWGGGAVGGAMGGAMGGAAAVVAGKPVPIRKILKITR